MISGGKLTWLINANFGLKKHVSMIAVPKLLRCYDCDSFIDRHRTQVTLIIISSLFRFLGISFAARAEMPSSDLWMALITLMFTEHCSGALRLPFAAIRLPESVASCQGGRALLQVVYHHHDSRCNVWKAVFKDVIWFFCSQEQFCVLAHR